MMIIQKKKNISARNKKIDARRIGGCNVGGGSGRRPHQIVVMQHHKSNNIVSTSATAHRGRHLVLLMLDWTFWNILNFKNQRNPSSQKRFNLKLRRKKNRTLMNLFRSKPKKVQARSKQDPVYIWTTSAEASFIFTWGQWCANNDVSCITGSL